ncbi:uncharacterized protein AKAME5_002387900 [Lates japonicus]|uniref:Uncharacterized protein n=1 Tax=Lates japonicus TaxID=270547 RepID=A0AAD3RJA6_LATJO|nr:uncharacterized protein AKAME5_002992700 [Lates japonicus]GLD59543.1 uncharacterized protein AKAME5_002992800 [Lates japonicus]GLD72554.1 uncharacterized protein AKAME5_002387900 [Lates japonicus]
MGGSSSKRTFFWQKKKKSPLNKAWNQLQGALPNKKRKRKSILSLDKLNLDNLRKEKHSQKRFSLPTDKKEPISLKRFSLGNIRKESAQTALPGKKEKDGGGLGKVGEQIKRKFSQEPKRQLSTQQEVVPPSVNMKQRKEENETNDPKNGTKVSKKKLSEFMTSIRQTGAKANGQIRPKES